MAPLQFSENGGAERPGAVIEWGISDTEYDLRARIPVCVLRVSTISTEKTDTIGSHARSTR
jgi:hypothetical protein